MWQSFGVHAVEPFRPMPFSCPFLLLFLLLILLLLFYCLLARTILFLFGLARPVPWCALLGRVALRQRRTPPRERALQRTTRKEWTVHNTTKYSCFSFPFFFFLSRRHSSTAARAAMGGTHTKRGPGEAWHTGRRRGGCALSSRFPRCAPTTTSARRAANVRVPPCVASMQMMMTAAADPSVTRREEGPCARSQTARWNRCP